MVTDQVCHYQLRMNEAVIDDKSFLVQVDPEDLKYHDYLVTYLALNKTSVSYRMSPELLEVQI